MLRIKLLVMIWFLSVNASAVAHNMKNDVFICYGKFNANTVKNFKYVIVESDNLTKQDVATLKENNDKVLAYLSLGEVNQYAKHFETLKPYVLEKNNIWNSYVINISNNETKNELLTIINNHINKHKFDGLFLDNIDNYTSYGKTPHLASNLYQFLNTVKTTYPNIYLIQNAGLEIAQHTKQYINTIAIESVITDYNFENKKYQLRNNKGFEYKKTLINKLIQTHNLPFVFIEYADSKQLTKKIQHKLERNFGGCHYFIGQIDLQNIPVYND